MDSTEAVESSEDPDQQRGASPQRGAVAPGVRANEAVGEGPLFSRAFVALLGMQAAYGFSFSLFFLLPKYLAALGESPSRIGLVMGGFGVACISTIPFLPMLLAKVGRRGALVFATLLLSFASAAFALLPLPGVMAIPLRAAEGVTWTIMFSTAMALTAEMAPRSRLAQAIGIAGAASLIMNAIAPAIGEPLADHFGYRSVFALATLSSLVASALAWRLPVGNAAPREHEPVLRSAEGGGALLAPPSRSRVPLYLVFSVAGLGYGVLSTFLAPYALAKGIHAIRTFFIAYTFSALCVRVLGGRLSDRLGHASVASWAVLAYGLVVASTGALAPYHLAVLGFVFGLAHGAAFPALMALLVGGTSPHQRPRVLGIANGSMSLGMASVYPAGLLVSRLGYPAMFAVAGALTAAASFLLRESRK